MQACSGLDISPRFLRACRNGGAYQSCSGHASISSPAFQHLAFSRSRTAAQNRTQIPWYTIPSYRNHAVRPAVVCVCKFFILCICTLTNFVCHSYMGAALQHSVRHCSELVVTCGLSRVRAALRLFDALATPANGVALLAGNDAEESGWLAMVELWWQFAVTWGIGGPLSQEGRKACAPPLPPFTRIARRWQGGLSHPRVVIATSLPSNSWT